MEIKLHKEIHLNEFQSDYIQKKVARLKKLAGKFWSEASFVNVEIKKNSVADNNKLIHCALKMPLPGETLYASVDERTVEACIDLAEDKIAQQIDKYKGKH